MGELLNGEIFYSMNELRVLAERWRVHDTHPVTLLAGLQATSSGDMNHNNMGHGEVKTDMRFLLLHTPDGGYLNSEIAALHALF